MASKSSLGLWPKKLTGNRSQNTESPESKRNKQQKNPAKQGGFRFKEKPLLRETPDPPKNKDSRPVSTLPLVTDFAIAYRPLLPMFDGGNQPKKHESPKV